MPPLEEPPEHKTITLPPRKAIIAKRADVAIIGAGPAGVGAALGAAQAGASVVVIDRYGFPGGNATIALVAPLMSFHTHHEMKGQKIQSLPFFPSDHGTGEAIIDGVVSVVVERLIEKGGAIPPSAQTGYVIAFDHEIYKQVVMDLFDEHGVEYLFHAFCSGYIENEVPSVILETKSGPLIIEANCVVDCTGDGDVAAFAGATYDVGRASDGLVQPMSIYFRVGDVNKSEFLNYAKKEPDQWRGVNGLWNLVKEARELGEFTVPRKDILLFATPHEKELSVNSTRILRVLGTNVWDLTFAEYVGRKQIQEIVLFFRKYVPGFRGAYVLQSGVQVGVRESRRIHGDYKLTADDILHARRFEDCIARSTYPIDIHDPKGHGTVLRHLPPGLAYDIPFRCLIPKGLNHILVAGRCISGTHEAHSSYRVMPVAMALGHAAGVGAALSALNKTTPRALDHRVIQTELIKQGASLGI